MTRYLAELLILCSTIGFLFWLAKSLVSDWYLSKAQADANKYKAALKLISSSPSNEGPSIASSYLDNE